MSPGLVAAFAALAGACSDVTAPGEPPRGSLEVVAEGLDAPTHLTAPPDDPDRLFVVEQPGRIRVIVDGVLRPTPFLDISGLVRSGGEQGLLSMAFHPDYAANGHFYVDYTDNAGDTRVVRYSVSGDPDVAAPSSATLVLSVEQPFGNHNGGQIAFGPDGMLYIGMGDGGSGGDPDGHGQNRATLLGSILRVDVDGGSPYSVPADNPFVEDPGSAPETWAYGVRNPWRFSFDRQTGDLYIGDVGQNRLEEISFQPGSSSGGENYGWNTMEGDSCYAPANGCDQSGLELPIHTYAHDDGCSVTGGFVYRGQAEPSLRGRYFFADFCRTWIRSLAPDGSGGFDVVDHTDDFGAVSQIASFGEDARGELYVVSLGGTLYRIVSPTG